MTRYLTPFSPRRFSRAFVSPKMPGPPGGGPPGLQRVGLAGVLWATWDQAQPANFALLTSSATTKGYNWQMWEDALTARILARGGSPAAEILHAGAQVSLAGEAVLDLCSMLDVVFLGNWMSKEMVQAIKARSTAPGGTRVYFWADFESFSQVLDYHQKQEVESPMRGLVGIGDGVLLPAGATVNPTTGFISGGFNDYGEPLIDKQEQPWVPGETACPHIPSHGQPAYAPSGPHLWDADIYKHTGSGLAGSAQALKTLGFYTDLLDRDWQVAGKWVADGFAFDRLLTAPFKGTATNDYTAAWPAEYVAGWQAFLQTWRQAMATKAQVLDQTRVLWGNTTPGIVHPYSTELCLQRYVEHFFREADLGASTLAQLTEKLQDIARYGQRAILGLNGSVGGQWYWATTAGGPTPAVHGTWAKLMREIKDLGLRDRLYVAAWQTLPEAYAYWQEDMREPS